MNLLINDSWEPEHDSGYLYAWRDFEDPHKVHEHLMGLDDTYVFDGFMFADNYCTYDKEFITINDDEIDLTV